MSDPFLHALRQAHQALRRGDRATARRWAWRALQINAHHEAPWLILAALSPPRASVEYARRALEVRPHSRIARRSLDWALRRLRRSGDFYRLQAPTVQIPLHPQAYLPARRSGLPIWSAWLLFVLALMLVWFTAPAWAMQPRLPAGRPHPAGLNKPTFTPTPTPTFTPTPTPTNTPTPTPTFTPSPTPTFTPTFTPRPPTATPRPVTAPRNSVSLPEGVGPDEPWVDVDLTHQRAYAYRGTTLVRSFIVSTGVWNHPTVTGTYRIYVKYRYADMAGPGYYLPDVPYVMYFYRGYGLHGTYWHHNFGTPMSHGCVNFTIEDAAWLFNFTSVGTVVHIHY